MITNIVYFVNFLVLFLKFNFSEDFTEVSDDPHAYNFTAQIDELNSANIWLGQMLPRYTFNVVDLGTVMAKAIHNREVELMTCMILKNSMQFYVPILSAFWYTFGSHFDSWEHIIMNFELLIK